MAALRRCDRCQETRGKTAQTATGRQIQRETHRYKSILYRRDTQGYPETPYTPREPILHPIFFATKLFRIHTNIQ